MRALLVVLVLAACTGDDPALGHAAADDAGALPVDGGTSPPPSADAPSTYCSSKSGALWCEDFDTLTDTVSLVPEISEPALAPKLSQETFRSAPRALRMNLLAGQPSPQYTVIKRAFPTDRAIRLSVDWRLALLEPTEGQTLQSLTLKRKTGQVSVGRTCGAAADAGPPPCTTFVSTCVFAPDAKCEIHPIEKRLAGLDAWSHVVLEARFAAKGHARFEEDGETRVDVDAATEAAPAPADEPVSATVGIAVLQGAAGATDIFFDDVLVEAL